MITLSIYASKYYSLHGEIMATRRKRIYKTSADLNTFKYLKGVKVNKDWWYTATLINSPKYAYYQMLLTKKLTSPEVIDKVEEAKSYDRVKVVGEAVKEVAKEYRETSPDVVMKEGASVLKAIEATSKEIEERAKAIESLVALIPT